MPGCPKHGHGWGWAPGARDNDQRVAIRTSCPEQGTSILTSGTWTLTDGDDNSLEGQESTTRSTGMFAVVLGRLSADGR